MAKNLSARMFLFARSLWVVPVSLLVLLILIVHTFSAPVQKLSGFRTPPFVRGYGDHGYLFYSFLIGAFVFIIYVDRKYPKDTRQAPSNISLYDIYGNALTPSFQGGFA